MMDAPSMQGIRFSSCPVCNGGLQAWRKKTGGSQVFDIDRCTGCGYAFVNPRPTLAYLLDYYAASGHGHGKPAGRVRPTAAAVVAQETVYPNSTLDAAALVGTACRLLPQGHRGKFLDVGCGYGFFSRAARESGFDVTALELAEEEFAISQEIAGIMPIRSSFEDFDAPASSYSAILMSQILEHALDINRWLDKAAGLLQPGGVIAIALPSFDSAFRRVLQERDPYICPPAHLNFFGRDSLSRLVARHGFAIERVGFVSRIPRSTFEKRLRGPARVAVPAVHAASRATLKALDSTGLGMMLHIHARKPHAA